MRMINPLQLNDLDIKSFLRIVLAIQLAMFGVIGLDAIGLQIPILRQLVCFIYLTFIPGILIIRVLKLHKLSNIEALLYTIGLSIATLMFTGLFVNVIYPFFGISKPISLTPLMITISILVLILCILSYIRDKDFSAPSSYIDIKEIFSPPVLFLCLIPFLAIFGTYLVNFHKNNILLIILIIVIALIPPLIAFNKFISKKLYPLAVFVIAVSLLYHRSLTTMYLVGWDTHIEAYWTNSVLANHVWNPKIPDNNNAMLSLTVLAPTLSLFLGIDTTWIFKVIYPLFFSLVPVSLYSVFQKQIGEKYAFLSVFFFMAVFPFYYDMVGLMKQSIAEIFLALLMLLMVSDELTLQRKLPFIIFTASLIASHYGTSYIFMIILAISSFIILSKKLKPTNNLRGINLMRLNFVCLYIVLAVTWYTYIASSSPFVTITNLGKHIFENIGELFNVNEVQPLYLLTSSARSWQHELIRIINVTFQIFIVIGIVKILLGQGKEKLSYEYLIFSISWILVLSAGLMLPYFFSWGAIDAKRAYHLSLFFLAPFSIIGGIKVFRIISKSTRSEASFNFLGFKAMTILLAFLLLFNTGFVDEITGAKYPLPSPFAFSKYEDSNLITKIGLSSTYTNEHNVFSARWLSYNRENDIKIYADYISEQQVLRSYGMILGVNILSSDTQPCKDSYIYLRYLNVIDGTIIREQGWGRLLLLNKNEILSLLGEKIYTNGGSEIYYYE